MRNIKITVRLTEKEHARLKKQSSEAGLKMEPYIRKLIMGSKIHPRPPDSYGKFLKEINAIGVNINQIARVANSERHITSDKINEAAALIGKVMDIVRGV